jgi:DNA-binding XRE family transcriptional regulator
VTAEDELMGFEQQGDLSWRELLTLYRGRAGLTKHQLADLTGIPRTTLWRIETGVYPPTLVNKRVLEEAIIELLESLVDVKAVG